MYLIPLTYLIASTLSPGPVTVLTVHNTIRYGRYAGIAVALGGAVTMALFVAVAALLAGGNGFFDVSPRTATLYQQGGAIFILVMGLLTGYRSLSAQPEAAQARAHSGRLGKSFLTGLGLMIPYFPQAILFYTVILPHQTQPTNLVGGILLMGACKVVMTVGWYTAVALAAKPLQGWFFNSKIQQAVEFVGACFLVGMGITVFMG